MILKSIFETQYLALIALGSNLGDSRALIHRAFKRLQAFSEEPILCSSLWKTAPVDCPPGSPDFLNAAAALVPRSDESPETLLSKLQNLEGEFGRRTKTILNEARPLDLDLIAFADQIRDTTELILPHPRAHQRAFVLRPLAEIVPEFVLPGQKLSIAQLLERMHDQ